METGRHALLADIGGTHARFALLGSGDLEPFVFETADYADFQAAFDAYRRRAGITGSFTKAAVCVAGPVSEAGAELTNCDWKLTVATIREATDAEAAVLVNDFTAVALSLQALGSADLRKLGGGQPVPGAARAVLGPGTGLGVSGLIPDGRGGFAPLSGEGGHVDLAPTTAREIEILVALLERYGHVSAERVLSGPGLQTIYETLAALDGEHGPALLEPEEIAGSARAKESPIAIETIALFTGWLGSVAGDLALTLGARGGVYIAGGIVNRWGEMFDTALFRQRFEAKGRFQAYLARIPTWLITDPHAAFKGLAHLVGNTRPV